MHLAMVGLGRMGMNMARRLLKGGHQVVAYNRTSEKTDNLVKEGAVGAYSLGEVVEKLSSPRVIWVMLPAGAAVDEHINALIPLLASGDMVVEGGNSYYKDDVRRAATLSEKGIQYVDVGVSGGIWGLQIGYCLMVGGSKDAFAYLEPIFKALAPEDGYLYCGDTGAGHFVKMVHNGIEYGMMQAYGEGFQILASSPYGPSLHFADLARLWNRGSVVRSWLLELAEAAFSKSDRLTDITGFVEDSGEGRWTVQQAIETGVAAPVIALSLMKRFQSQETDSFSDKVVAALRREFGGHGVVEAEKK
ncbi:MAG: decarboxylating 6-phosphogluconate dehydrogenase [Deltaproteobacteria bacterium]|nr:decarboxylating 6-phosphogluconate dehydrogenase [Deltaproteobacteria bacterium]